MSSLDRWAEDFTRAIEGYRRDATSKLISYDSSRLYTYISQHPEDFPKVMEYIHAEEWGPFRMKDLLGKYLRFRGVDHKIVKITPKDIERTGGTLYAKATAAIFKGEE